MHMNNNDNNLKATQKSPALEKLFPAITGVSRVGAVAEGSCVMCYESANWFRDDLSEKEYTISGMCQPCQDSVFGISEE